MSEKKEEHHPIQNCHSSYCPSQGKCWRFALCISLKNYNGIIKWQHRLYECIWGEMAVIAKDIKTNSERGGWDAWTSFVLLPVPSFINYVTQDGSKQGPKDKQNIVPPQVTLESYPNCSPCMGLSGSLIWPASSETIYIVSGSFWCVQLHKNRRLESQ